MTVRQASCVVIEGRAVLIEGEPGIGKSSLALALMDRGGHFCPVAEAGEYNRIVLGFLQES